MRGRRLRRLAAALLLLLAAGLPAVAAERWGWFGIRIRDLSETEAEELSIKHGLGEGYGVVVVDVIKDAPAAGAGLRNGDLIVAIDDRPVVETRGLQRIVGATAAGREVAVVVLREGARRELRVRVGPMPPDVVAERVAAEFGFLIREPAPQEGPTAATPGPVVGAVLERSAAERGGLKVGDRIVAIGGVPIGSIDAARGRLETASLRDALRLSVVRRGETLALTLPPAQPGTPTH